MHFLPSKIFKNWKHMFLHFLSQKNQNAHTDCDQDLHISAIFHEKKMQNFKICVNPLVNGIFEFFSNISSFDADFSPKFLPKSKCSEKFLMKNHAFFCGQIFFFKNCQKFHDF